MQDPWVKGAGWKLGDIEPQLCYLDHIEAWSVNECTINWNTPLAWVTGYLTENNCDVSNIKIGGTNGVVEVSANNNKKDDSSKSSSSKKDDSSSKKKDDKKTDSSDKEKLGLVPILIFILLAIISIEVFIFSMVKMSKGKNKKDADKNNIGADKNNIDTDKNNIGANNNNDEKK